MDRVEESLLQAGRETHDIACVHLYVLTMFIDSLY